MNKKADKTLSALGEIILAGIILLLLIVPTIYLIKSYYSNDTCPNQEGFKTFINAFNHLERQIQQETEFPFFNEGCYIVSFSQDERYHEIKPPQNAYTSPFICLCSIKNDQCSADSKESCVDAKTFTQINDKQFTTEGLDRYIFLTLKRDDKKLLINLKAQQQEEQGEILPEVQNCKLEETPLNIKSKPCISIDIIKKVLSEADSPSLSEDQDFANNLYDYGVYYNIDPAIAIAFFRKESTYGKFGVARRTKSVGNIRYTNSCDFKYEAKYGAYCGYNTWSRGAEAWYKLISGPSYIGSGRDTIEKIVPKYCPATECNVEKYISQIRSYVKEYRKMQKEASEPLIVAEK